VTQNKTEPTGAVRLEAWLAGAGKSQGWLADTLGVSRQAVNGWVRGTRRPTIEAAIGIRDATGGVVTVESWVGGAK
tara:strand:+ start:85 stop:312 length:228 start_codon:yes stop_codon:yes gene_type:complete